MLTESLFSIVVFMPIDNMVRYHYALFLRDHNVSSLGAVMHTLQDVCVPHHAAGYIGNFHSSFESESVEYINKWSDDTEFLKSIRNLYEVYNHFDPHPPLILSINDHASKFPGRNWRKEVVVTWLALGSCSSYENIYGGFRGGSSFNEANAKDLVRKAIAL
jgi:hypothetical protein